MKIHSLSLLLFAVLCSSFHLQGQDLEDVEQLTVYLDCSFCNTIDIREKVNYVDYVRDALLSDVHILATSVRSGAGVKHTFRFIGQRLFAGTGVEHSISVSPDLTTLEIRGKVRKVIELGLTQFWSQTKMAEYLEWSVEGEKSKESKVDVGDDPWNNWVFEINGGISGDYENVRKRSRLWGRLDIDRVTEIWRIRNLIYFRDDYQVFAKNDDEIRSVINRRSVSSSVVRSINDHLSAGFFISAAESTFNNLNLSTREAPALEYSFFPYTEVQERQLTIAYRVSHFYRDYTETTIYEKDAEHLYGQSLVMSARFTQPWGRLYAQLEGSHFFHDARQNRIEFESRLNIRVVRGLSLSVGHELEFIRDQRSLPRRDISLEELLLAQRQAATSFRLGGQMGISYTFGSIYNNIVNTRL